MHSVRDPQRYRFFRVTVNGEKKLSLYISSLNFHVRYVFIFCLHGLTTFIVYLLKTKKPHAGTQPPPVPRPAPPIHGVGAAAYQQLPGGWI